VIFGQKQAKKRVFHILGWIIPQRKNVFFDFCGKMEPNGKMYILDCVDKSGKVFVGFSSPLPLKNTP